MLNKNVFAAVVLAVAASGAVMAESPTMDVSTYSDAQTVSRAEVIAELRAAKAAGTLQLAGEQSARVLPATAQTSSVSRASVRAEAQQIARAHMFNELTVN
jgi:hypothetical protein